MDMLLASGRRSHFLAPRNSTVSSVTPTGAQSIRIPPPFPDVPLIEFGVFSTESYRSYRKHPLPIWMGSRRGGRVGGGGHLRD